MSKNKEDIVERIRGLRYVHVPAASQLFEEACQEIERLREAIRRLAAQDATLSVQGGNVIVEIDAPEREAEPAAWGVLRVGGGWVSILADETQAETSSKSWDKNENWVHEVIPLYRSPTLTDAERAAVGRQADYLFSKAKNSADIHSADLLLQEAATLRGLLERTAH